jgi:hypothetical protein
MRRHEEGKGRLKAVFALGILAATIYLGFKVIPPYVNNYDLSQHLQQVAEDAVVHRIPDAHAQEDKIKQDVVSYADDLGLPVSADNVKVSAGSTVTIDLDYTVPIDLKVYTLMLHFTPSTQRRQI